MKLPRRMLLAATATLAMPQIGRAQGARRWRCVTSWAKNLPGPGVSAARLAKRITTMSEGALTIEVFAAGEIVPALSVFDAVSNGTVEMGHSAALFWQGKMPAAPVFTTMPFGMGPAAHAGWVENEGQDFWDAIYGAFGVKALLAGNTGPSTAGWFRQPIAGASDIRGMRIRVSGLGGAVYARMGATPLVISPGETYTALERGLIDAAEFLAPANDLALGLQRIAPYLAFPGFNKPNGASELIIDAALWRDLPGNLRAIIEAACRAEHDQGLAEAERMNAIALKQAVEAGAKPFRLPQEVLSAARAATDALVAELRARDDITERCFASCLAARDAAAPWQKMQIL